MDHHNIDLSGQGLEPEPYIVLDSDYTNFASVYSCHHYVVYGGVLRREFAWVISREQDSLDNQDIKARAIRAFADQHIDVDRLVWNNLTQC